MPGKRPDDRQDKKPEKTDHDTETNEPSPDSGGQADPRTGKKPADGGPSRGDQKKSQQK